MGILETEWSGNYRGHSILVHRNDLTKGFSLLVDGVEVAKRKWSWIGLGELRGRARIEGREVEVVARLVWGGLHGRCSVEVGAEAVVMTLR